MRWPTPMEMGCKEVVYADREGEDVERVGVKK